jgi:hypothetical protein
MQGTCAPLPAGSLDAANGCAAVTCDKMTMLTTAACDGAGMCQKTTVECSPYKCRADMTVCPTSCMGDGDCAMKMKCSSSGSGGDKTCTADM